MDDKDMARLLSIMDERDVRYAQRFEAQQVALKDAMAAAKEAVAKAEAAAERRFESVNEFRAQLGDQATRLLPRAEAEAAMANLRERIDNVAALLGAMGTRIDRTEGRSTGLNAGWGYLLGAMGALSIIISIVMILLKT